MATNKPRITVTLTSSQHRILKALSGYTGQSMSAYVSEMLAVSEPTLERMAATFQRIKQASDLRKQEIIAQLEEAQAVFEPLAMAAVEQSDLFLARLDEAATGAPPASPKRSLDGRTERTGAATSPPTNRGVTPLHEKPSKPAPRKAPKPAKTVTLLSKKRGLQS